MKEFKKVFCVEDNTQIAQILQLHLEKLGYQMCGIADNARDAVAAIEACKPDIVLVDIELHGKPEGIDIGNFLNLKTDIPFVYLTGHDDTILLAKARKTTPNGYLLKPFDRNNLKVALDMAQRVG